MAKILTEKGLDMTSKQHTLLYSSSYDRGLDHLLFIWSDIKKEFPDAELHICYGWDLFIKANHNNPERMMWKSNVEKLMKQDGIIHHGRVGKKELAKVRELCGIWAYPTDFDEISCITAMEAQDSGLVPVTMDKAALSETVKAGVLVKGDIKKPEVLEEYKKELLNMMRDKELWEKESRKAQKKVRQYQWTNVATKWVDVFNEPISTPSVSVITVTIREGFFNLMAHNLSEQTYPIKEWIIIDDHPEDRSSEIEALKAKYNLSITYCRGVKGKKNHKRRYGIVSANNIGWKKSSGDLLVYLQDFIVIPKDGIEQLVDVYRSHPNAIIAPTDVYYECKKPNMSNKSDWWDGETDVLTGLAWRNIRNEFKGLRITDNPFDFEMNYGAIPRKVLDDLNGFYEFMENGLGFDNTDIGYRHLLNGGEIILDDTNVCKCINLWPWIGGTEQNVHERERHMGGPFYAWQKKALDAGKLPIVRDEKLDAKISIDYHVPDEIPDEKCKEWIKDNLECITDDIPR